jgi:polyadenylate-binding protein
MTRRSLGYAYVNYLNSSDGMRCPLSHTPNFDFIPGERALEQLNYSLIKNRPWLVLIIQKVAVIQIRDPE